MRLFAVVGLLFSLFFASPSWALPKLELAGNASGNLQHGEPGEPLKRPVGVRVVDSLSGAPVAGMALEFSTVASPDGGLPATFSRQQLETDADGYARTQVILGDKDGVYVVAARMRLPDLGTTESVYFQVTARSKQWLLTLLMELAAGLALFMFGLSQLSDGMRKSAGRALRGGMQLITRNRILALALGALVTVVLQSSTATTVLLVGFVQAGLLSFAQTLGVILGADIGTTMTVQLISFKVTDYALIPVALGFTVMATAKRDSWKQTGEALMGAGLIFYGMAMMADSISPLKHHEPFLSVIPRFSHPLAAIVVGTTFTALLHSSAAFIGIVIVFAAQGLLSVQTGIALCLGANIGTCITAVLASLNASVEAKRVAAGHTLFKILGVLLIAPWLDHFAKAVSYFSGGAPSAERAIANAHTIFNIGIAFLFLPFLNPFAKLVQRIIPEPRKPEREKVLLDDSLVSTPALALSAAKVEVMRLGRKAQAMVEVVLEPVFADVPLSREAVLQRENEVDDAYAEINLYLKKIIANESSAEHLEEAFQMMRTAKDFEQIADVVEDQLLPSVMKLKEFGKHFSEQGRAELQEYRTKTLKQVSRALNLFESLNLEQARHVSERFEKYRLLAGELQDTHFTRLKLRIREAEDTSLIHLDILSSLLEVSDLATNIARNMLRTSTPRGGSAVHPIAQAAP